MEEIKIINKIAIIIRRILIVVSVIIAIAFPISIGKNTWNDLDIKHPILTIIGFIFFKGILDWIIATLFFPGVKEKSIDAKE